MEHRMIYEIKEQPEIIRRLVTDKDSAAMDGAVAAIKMIEHTEGNIYLVGNGTSYHACIYGQFILSVRSKLVVNIYDTSEFGDYISNLKQDDVLVMVSQSGETGDAVGLIAKIKDQKSKLIIITNYPESTLGQAADIVVPMQADECLAIPNTKGYTAVMSIFALLAEKVRGDNDFSSQANNIAADVERIVRVEYDRIRQLSDRMHSASNIFALGHASGLSNAYEAALKLKECSHIEAEGYSGLEFRHGPSSVVGSETPVIVFMADYESEEDLSRTVEELATQDAYIVGIGSVENLLFDERFDAYEDNLYACIPAIVPMQILAYELALARGINPDEPSGVQRVVK